MYSMDQAPGQGAPAPRVSRGRFALQRFFAPTCLLAALASGCVIDDRDPVRDDDGNPGTTVDGGADNRTGIDVATDRATLPDGQRVDGGDAGSSSSPDGASSPDAPLSDRTSPPPTQDGSVPDVGSSDRTSTPDTPVTPPPDVSQDTTTPPPPIDGSVVDTSMPPPPVDVTNPPSDTGPTCPSPQIECSGKCVSPTDPKTCGSCTHDCTNLPHVSGTVTCSAGACVVPPTSCEPGWAHCSTRADDGCEVDITKPSNCGSCATVCSGTTPLCASNSPDAGASGYQCKSQCSAPSPDLCGMSCVNKTSDPLNCGTCGNACMAPATHGQANCVNSMCGYKCNTNYSACGNDCVDFNNDPLNCQSCGHACAAPAAHGKAICTTGACGFSCDSGYPNACGGTCVNFSNDPANCGSCGGACQPPANGSVTGCSGGQCQTTCNDGYDKVGANCVLTRFYVDEQGNDNNPGTEASPFKTWKRAAARAGLVAGSKIYFKTGVFSSASPEDFTVKIPDGITVSTVGGKVLLQGNGVAGLAFAGSGTINGGSTVDGLTLEGFSEPLSTSTGTQTISNVTLTQIQTPMFISGTSMTISNFAMSSNELSGQFRHFSGTLTMSNGTATSVVSSCFSASPTANSLEASQTFTANQVTFDGNLYFTGATAVFTGSTLMSTCASQNRALSATTGNLTLTNCQTMHLVELDGTTAKVRGTTFNGGLRMWNGGSYDFGTTGSRGNNVFNAGVSILGMGTVLNGVGNKWIPNEPPAGANGDIDPAMPNPLTGSYNSGNLYIPETSSSLKW